jgi:RimJ/RimL family protein N-acetyltransferase
VTLEYPSPPLTDGIALLRPWAEADVPCVVEGKQCDHAAALAWITDQWQRQSEGAGFGLAIADPAGGEALGCISLLYRPEAGRAPAGDGSGEGLVYVPDRGILGLGYWVIERARRRGLASSAARVVSDWALGEAGIARLEALTETDNIASQRVLERAGYRREGRLASYLMVSGGRADALLYARTR